MQKNHRFKKDNQRLKRINLIEKVIIPYIILMFFGVIFLLPFLWLVSTSLKSAANVFQFPPQWIPNPIMWSNYSKAVRSIPFLTYFKNTIILSTIPIFGSVFASSMVAYSLSKIPWKGRKVLFGILLGTMMLPGQVTMIPIYAVWSKANLTNSFAPLLIPSLFGGGFNIFLLRQSFMTLPDSLLDAARIDGAREFRIFAQIVMPLSRPVITTISLFTFMGGWNDFMGPLLYLNDSIKWPLSIGLQAFMYQYNQQWELLMAASVLFILPMIIVFFIGQKQFIQGIVMTGLK